MINAAPNPNVTGNQTTPSFPTYNPAQQNRSFMSGASMPPASPQATQNSMTAQPSPSVSVTKSDGPAMPTKPKFPDPTQVNLVKADGTTSNKSGSTNDSGNNSENPPKKKIGLKMALGIIVLFLVVLGSGAGFYLTQQSQDLRQQATSNGQCPAAEECPAASDSTILDSCDDVEDDGTPNVSVCDGQNIGRVESCGGTPYCCNGNRWSTNMTACPTVVVPTACNDTCTANSQCTSIDPSWACDETSNKCRLSTNPTSNTCEEAASQESICNSLTTLENCDAEATADCAWYLCSNSCHPSGTTNEAAGCTACVSSCGGLACGSTSVAPNQVTNVRVNGETAGNINLTSGSNLNITWNDPGVSDLNSTINYYVIVIWNKSEGTTPPGTCNASSNCVRYQTVGKVENYTAPANPDHDNDIYVIVYAVNNSCVSVGWGAWSTNSSYNLVANAGALLCNEACTLDSECAATDPNWICEPTSNTCRWKDHPSSESCSEEIIVDQVSCDSFTGTLTDGTVANTTTGLTYNITSSPTDEIAKISLALRGVTELPGNPSSAWAAAKIVEPPVNGSLSGTITYDEMIDFLVATGHDRQEIIDSGVVVSAYVFGPEGLCWGNGQWEGTGGTCEVNPDCLNKVIALEDDSITKIACNESCTSNAECKLTNTNYVCDATSNKCRLTSNLTSTSCTAANNNDDDDDDSIPIVGCNETCVTNSDCSNSNHICVTTADGSNKCRLESYTSSTSCVIPAGSTAQPSLPPALLQSGPEDWLIWLKAGLVTLGIATALFFLL